MSIEEMISRMEFVACAIDGKKGAKVSCGTLDAKTIRSAIALLKTHPEAQPNEPLTLEELREMEGKPVWIKKLTGYGVSEYGIVHLCPPPDVADPKVIRVVNGAVGFEQILPYPKNKKQKKYGNTWIAYRRPPKED